MEGSRGRAGREKKKVQRGCSASVQIFVIFAMMSVTSVMVHEHYTLTFRRPEIALSFCKRTCALAEWPRPTSEAASA